MRRSRQLDQEFADITPLQKQVDDLQAVASGQAQPAVNTDSDVQAAQKQVDAAQTAYEKAAANAQCELNGSCGTGNAASARRTGRPRSRPTRRRRPERRPLQAGRRDRCRDDPDQQQRVGEP